MAICLKNYSRIQMETQYMIASQQNQLKCPLLFILRNLLQAFIISIALTPRGIFKKWELR